MTVDEYLIDVGIRASDYGREVNDAERILLKAHVDYFKRCHEKGLSAYKALLFFHDYLRGDYKI